MRLRVKLFATYGEIAGSKEFAWTAKEGERLGDFLDALFQKYPRLAGHRQTMLLAVNHSFAPPDEVLHDGDEIALMPPVSGGAA